MTAPVSGAIPRATIDVAALRAAEFPWADRDGAAYLNNASTGPLPRRAALAAAEFTRLREEPHRLTMDHQWAVAAEARRRFASLLGADAASIGLMVNTTYGLNVAALSLPLGSGDVILTHDREFPSNVYVWQALAKRGVRLELVPNAGGLPDEDRLLRMMDEVPGVKLVSVSWVQFATGHRADLARIGAACRERGIWFVVDGIQGLGALTIDVASCHVDVFACGAQKWLLSPWGTGFVYVRPELVRTLDPSPVGWLSVAGSDDFSRLVDYDLTYRDDARRFEVFTLPFQDFAGTNASLALLDELGPLAVERRIAGLASRIVRWADGRAGVRLVTPADPARRAGVVSVAPADPAAAAARLTAANVQFSLREGAIRLSPHVYNSEAEVDRALEALEDAAAGVA